MTKVSRFNQSIGKHRAMSSAEACRGAVECLYRAEASYLMCRCAVLILRHMDEWTT